MVGRPGRGISMVGFREDAMKMVLVFFVVLAVVLIRVLGVA